MSNRRAPWSERAVQLMADGRWHDRERIVPQLLDLVPPGRAMRQAEADRLRLRKGRGSEAGGRRIERSPEYLRRVGARAVVMDSLHQMCHRRTGADGKTYIRLRSVPDFKEGHL